LSAVRIEYGVLHDCIFVQVRLSTEGSFFALVPTRNLKMSPIQLKLKMNSRWVSKFLLPSTGSFKM